MTGEERRGEGRRGEGRGEEGRGGEEERRGEKRSREGMEGRKGDQHLIQSSTVAGSNLQDCGLRPKKKQST